MVSITRILRAKGLIMKSTSAQFIDYLRNEKRKSENTCLSYDRDLRQFSGWLCSSCGITSVRDVTGDMINTYMDYLTSEGKSPATVSRAVASVKALFSYAKERGICGTDPVSAVRAPKVFKKKPGIISDKDILKLLSQPDFDTPKGKRDKAMLELLMDTGLRVSELISIKLSDINLQKRFLTVKAAKERTVPFDKKTQRYISEYIENGRAKLLQELPENGYLFLNVSGETMSRQGFWKVLKKYGEEAGITEELTPHTLRHSFAAHALKSGKDVKEVQAVMGHADISTTASYLEL